MHFQKLGEKEETLLFLHGWQQSSADLKPLAKILSKDYTCYLLDLPGFGRTPLEDEEWGTAEYVQEVKKFIEEKNIKPLLVGHSFGGKIALKLSTLYPESTAEKLVLIGTPGLPQEKSIIKKLRFFYVKIAGKTIKLIDLIFRSNLFQNYFTPRYGSKDYQTAGQLRKLLVKTVTEDLSEFAKKSTKETLIINGDKDTSSPPEIARKYSKLIKNSRLEIMPNFDHYPFEDVGSHITAKIISEFIKR